MTFPEKSVKDLEQKKFREDSAKNIRTAVLSKKEGSLWVIEIALISILNKNWNYATTEKFGPVERVTFFNNAGNVVTFVVIENKPDGNYKVSIDQPIFMVDESGNIIMTEDNQYTEVE